MQYILTDIEGTTTSVEFVYDTLFPYFSAHIKAFLAENANLDALRPHLQAVQQTVWEEDNERLPGEAIAEKLLYWTQTDRKHPALKALQGIVWRAAYESGAIKGHVYPDVPPSLARWQQQGLGLGIYSSGSVAAQRLLFGYSVFGDMTPYFSHYFDTGVGNKRETEAYKTILRHLQLPPEVVLFLSDVEAELDAAAAAGMQTVQLLRPGNTPGTRHRTAANFDDIQPYIP
jgi:enolase-phosphatase E1